MSYHQRRYRQESFGYGAPKMSHPKLLQTRVPEDTGTFSRENTSFRQTRYRQESYGYGAPKISRPKQPHRVLDDTCTFSRENMSCYQRRYRQESYGYGAPRVSRPKQPHRPSGDTGLWRSLPAWEKRFCEEVGGMPWKRFVKAKNNLYKTDKVYGWDDSAGLEAFNEAKQRFWAEHHGFPCNRGLPSADLYIDNVDWNLNVDPILSSEIKSLSDDENAAEVVKELEWFSIPLDQIKATGWDDCYTGPKLPEIVGN